MSAPIISIPQDLAMATLDAEDGTGRVWALNGSTREEVIEDGRWIAEVEGLPSPIITEDV